MRYIANFGKAVFCRCRFPLIFVVSVVICQAVVADSQGSVPEIPMTNKRSNGGEFDIVCGGAKVYRPKYDKWDLRIKFKDAYIKKRGLPEKFEWVWVYGIDPGKTTIHTGTRRTTYADCFEGPDWAANRLRVPFKDIKRIYGPSWRRMSVIIKNDFKLYLLPPGKKRLKVMASKLQVKKHIR